ncbi:Protein of unknown function [Gryllus bimaculatus]|nr:Protein of unknown function [Gryllus bimaculatus]
MRGLTDREFIAHWVTTKETIGRQLRGHSTRPFQWTSAKVGGGGRDAACRRVKTRWGCCPTTPRGRHGPLRRQLHQGLLLPPPPPTFAHLSTGGQSVVSALQTPRISLESDLRSP